MLRRHQVLGVLGLGGIDGTDRLRPGGLEVQRLAGALRDAVIEDVGVGHRGAERRIARERPPCTPRELLLKSVTLSRAALQLLIRVSCAPLTLEYKPSMGIVWRGPSPKIQVTPSARPSSWHEPQELQAFPDCLPRKSRGMMSRTGRPTRPLSGTPSAVKNTSWPTIRVWSNWPGSGACSMGRPLEHGIGFEVEYRHRHVHLVVDEAELTLFVHHDTRRDVARLEADERCSGRRCRACRRLPAAP